MFQLSPIVSGLRYSERIQYLLSVLGMRLMHQLGPEAAHDLMMWALQKKWFLNWCQPSISAQVAGMQTKIIGLGDLQHPIGLAAGLDKNALIVPALRKIGFSFLEVGTVTPLAQPGNPKPRLFRLPEQLALVNRMGFNSQGSVQIASRLKDLNWQHDPVPLGVNIGKNKSTPLELALDDYLQLIEVLHPYAAYVVVNLSSPNTEGLRDLASEEFVAALAEGVKAIRHKIWIKLDPDMPRKSFQSLVGSIAAHYFQGLVLTNTRRVTWPEIGGLSGHPLASVSSERLEWAYEVHKGVLPMVASGGILSGFDVFDRIARGADGTQIYTAFVYRGPWTVPLMLLELAAMMKQRGFSTIEDLKGSHYFS